LVVDYRSFKESEWQNIVWMYYTNLIKSLIYCKWR